MEQYSHDLLFSRGKEVCWRYNGLLYDKQPYAKLSENMSRGTLALQSEVDGWLDMSALLPSIEFRIWGAMPWRFCFNALDYPDYFGPEVN